MWLYTEPSLVPRPTARANCASGILRSSGKFSAASRLHSSEPSRRCSAAKQTSRARALASHVSVPMDSWGDARYPARPISPSSWGQRQRSRVGTTNATRRLPVPVRSAPGLSCCHLLIHHLRRHARGLCLAPRSKRVPGDVTGRSGGSGGMGGENFLFGLGEETSDDCAVVVRLLAARTPRNSRSSRSPCEIPRDSLNAASAGPCCAHCARTWAWRHPMPRT
jgi:hypothetical protein